MWDITAMTTYRIRHRRAHEAARLAVAITAALVLASTVAASPAQPAEDSTLHRVMPISAPIGEGPRCQQCHYCNRPTAEDDRAPATGPDVIIMDAIEGSYLPVPFDHRGHAVMAAMAGGCATCHHFTPEGSAPPPCRTCHEIGAPGTDIHKPGLKGAYHQQCMNCHRDWVDETDCGICHRARAGSSSGPAPVVNGSGDDLTGRAHPPIPEPQGELYEGRRREHAGERVVFRHAEHVNRFGFQCVECHHEPSCTRCHARENGGDRSKPLEDHHRPCLRCHKRDMDGAAVDANCERCHWREGRPLPARFDHDDTGWPLSRYHEGKSCRACHRTAPFISPERDCNACHGGWDTGTFDHAVTGQTLDETHAEVACSACHPDRRFDRPPTCDECHDAEDGGITFPAKRPGAWTPVEAVAAPEAPAD